MLCLKCGKDLIDCICPDKEERLKAIVDSPHLVTKVCKICGKHYAGCKCENPIWITVSGGKEVRVPGVNLNKPIEEKKENT